MDKIVWISILYCIMEYLRLPQKMYTLWGIADRLTKLEAKRVTEIHVVRFAQLAQRATMFTKLQGSRPLGDLDNHFRASSTGIKSTKIQ